MADRCLATTQDGKPCAAKPRPSSDFCPWHDPALAGNRAEWSRRGGQGKSNARRAAKAVAGMSLDDIDMLLGAALKGVLTNRFSPGQANAAASVARAMVVVREAGALERIEDRLDELERLAARGRFA
jgi:hypothetical protein